MSDSNHSSTSSIIKEKLAINLGDISILVGTNVFDEHNTKKDDVFSSAISSSSNTELDNDSSSNRIEVDANAISQFFNEAQSDHVVKNSSQPQSSTPVTLMTKVTVAVSATASVISHVSRSTVYGIGVGLGVIGRTASNISSMANAMTAEPSHRDERVSFEPPLSSLLRRILKNKDLENITQYSMTDIQRKMDDLVYPFSNTCPDVFILKPTRVESHLNLFRQNFAGAIEALYKNPSESSTTTVTTQASSSSTAPMPRKISEANLQNLETALVEYNTEAARVLNLLSHQGVGLLPDQMILFIELFFAQFDACQGQAYLNASMFNSLKNLRKDHPMSKPMFILILQQLVKHCFSNDQESMVLLENHIVNRSGKTSEQILRHLAYQHSADGFMWSGQFAFVYLLFFIIAQTVMMNEFAAKMFFVSPQKNVQSLSGNDKVNDDSDSTLKITCKIEIHLELMLSKEIIRSLKIE